MSTTSGNLSRLLLCHCPDSRNHSKASSEMRLLIRWRYVIYPIGYLNIRIECNKWKSDDIRKSTIWLGFSPTCWMLANPFVDRSFSLLNSFVKFVFLLVATLTCFLHFGFSETLFCFITSYFFSCTTECVIVVVYIHPAVAKAKHWRRPWIAPLFFPLMWF